MGMRDKTRAGRLGLLQLADSGFPAGGFAHSGGIETLVRSGAIRDATGLLALLRAQRRLSLDSGDAWFVRNAWEATRQGDGHRLAAIATEDVAARPAASQRRSALGLGQALLRASAAVFREEPAREQHAWVTSTLGDEAPRATVFGSILSVARADRDGAVDAYLFAAVSGMVAAAVRLGIVAPFEAQAVIRDVLAEPVRDEETGRSSFAPIFDIAAMRHELLSERLFAS